MKVLFLVCALFFVSNCADRISSTANKDVSLKTGEAVPDSIEDNTNNRTRTVKEADTINSDEREKLNLHNDKFRQTPAEFKNIDFENFKYPIVRLVDGEKDDFNPRNPLAGGQSFTLSDVFFINLSGDDKKEAVVMLSAVGCGASCDGGRDIIYFYSSRSGKPNLLGLIETGSKSGGCSLKSFVIKDKKIFTEQFGRCVKESDTDENEGYSCKFCVRDRTRAVYSFPNGQMRRESNEVIEVSESSVMNYSPEINVSE